jgi:alpha-mannosidase
MRVSLLKILAMYCPCFIACAQSDPCLAKIQWGYFSGGSICLVSSSHQDIAWLDTPQQCEINRDVQTITPALQYMRDEPNYCFAMEQALNLKEYLQRHPESEEEILLRAKENRFMWGATYIQPYESLESGEQLIRQTYFGRKWIKEILPGADMRVAYNVDVPGRAMQMPQILKKAGIDYLVISRQSEGIFNWRSPDGSGVSVFSNGYYSTPLVTYGNFKCDMPAIISKVYEKLSQRQEYYRRHNLPPIFCIYLCADGLHPVNYSDVCRQWNSLAEKFNQTSAFDNKMPTMKHTTTQAYMDSVVGADVKLDTIAGERPNLWLYIHGPTHHQAISAKRDAGILIPAAEMFSTIDSVLKGSFDNYPAQKLSDAWEASIYPDHGWGGKNGDITDEVFCKKFEYARDLGRETLNNSLVSIAARVKTAQKGRSVLVYNDLSFARGGIVKFKKPCNLFHIEDAAGKIVPYQISNDEINFYAANIPPIGYKTFYLVEDSNNSQSNHADSRVVTDYENEYYKAEFSPGGIKNIYDKKLKCRLLNTAKFLGGEIFSMQSNGNGAGEFVRMQLPSMENFEKASSQNSQWAMIETGPVKDVIQTNYSFADCNVVERIIFYRDFKNIDFEIDVRNWKGNHNREIRMALPLNLLKSQIAYEVPMGILKVSENEMKGLPGGWTDYGKYDQNAAEIHPREVQNFITANDSKTRITISGSVAVWDYIDPTSNPVDYPVLQPLILATRKSCHWEGNWYEQKGDHSFKFSFTSQKPDFARYWQTGIGANHPFYTVYDAAQNSDANLPDEKSFFSLTSDNALISAIKKCQDDNSVIIRLYDMEGKDTSLQLNVPFNISKVRHTNIIEEPGEFIRPNSNSIKIKLGKYSIETFKIEN